jgi:hypothetical protein
VTRDEHQAIIGFVEQAVRGDESPMDVEADAIIRALFKRNPDAAYRVTMLAMSMAGTLSETRTRVGGEPHEPGALPSRGRGWLSGLFERRDTVARRNEPAMYRTDY